MKKQIQQVLFNQFQNKYLLYDDFSTPRIAGSVNNSYAETIGGKRNVTDTNGKLSIANNMATFATGGLSESDPGLRYPSLSRVLGRTLLVYGVQASKSEYGWDSNTATGITNRFWLSASGLAAGLVVVSVWSIVSSTNYKLAIVLRANGAFYFAKGGNFPNWYFLWSETISNSTPMFPGAANEDTTSPFNISNMIVPKQLFIPNPLQSDGFSTTTTDGMGNPENNGPVGNSWTGATWTVASGSVTNTPTLGSEIVTNGDMETGSPPTGWSSFNMTTSRETTIVHAGTASLKGIATNSNNLMGQDFTSVAGSWYMANGWIYSDGSSTQLFRLEQINSPFTVFAFNSSTLASWTNMIITGRAPDTSSTIRTRTVNGATCYMDDVSVKALTLSTLFRSISSSSANILSETEIIRIPATQAGLVVNLDSTGSPANFVIAYLDGNGNCKLDKCVAGIYTNVIFAAVTYVASAVLRVIKDGTTYRLFYNSLLVGSSATISDAGIINNTLHGLFSTYSGNTFDNFVIWARGIENQYSQLDSM